MPTSLLTSREAAALLRVHPKHLYRLLRRGLPARKVGEEWRFVREELLAWSETASTKAPQREEAPSLIAANGDLAIELLLGGLGSTVGLVQADRGQGVAALSAGRVLAAGSHGPIAPDKLGRRAARIDLVDREIGLVFRKKSAITRIEQIVGKRLASRPATAGVRAHLDRALRDAGIDREIAYADATELPTHRDVVFSVLRGETDVGIASQAWASRAKLSFFSLTTERYGLLLFAEHLGDERVARMAERAQSRAYRDELRAVPGYATRHTGAVRYLAQGMGE